MRPLHQVSAYPKYLRAEALFRQARSLPGLIAAATPSNYAAEVERITQCVGRKERTVPRLEYRRDEGRQSIASQLLRFADGVEVDSSDPCHDLLAGRVREVCLELSLADAVGTSDVLPLARSRYGVRCLDADRLADAWIADHCEAMQRAASEPKIQSADPRNPRSLLSRMREEVARVVPGFRIERTSRLMSFAATGETMILVAEGRLMTEVDVERTVVHEVHGHALPQSKARAAEHPVFRVGTARGSDHQEGYALYLEGRFGHLHGARRAELGFRHLAARSVLDGASFADILDALLCRGAPPTSAARIALRAHRGGVDGVGGIAREAIYLPAWLRVEAISNAPELEALGHGRVSVDAAPRLQKLLPRAQSQDC